MTSPPPQDPPTRSEDGSLRGRAGRFSRGHIGWLLACLVSIPLIAGLDRRLVPTGPVLGTESAEVEARLARDFDTPFAATGILVVSGLAVDPASDSGRAVLRGLAVAIGRHRAVRAVVSPGTSLDTMLIGTDGSTAIALVGLDPRSPNPIDSLRAFTAGLTPALQVQHPALGMRWTGQPALIGDLRARGTAEARRAELIAVPVTAVVALWAFGSLGGTGLGLLAALVTVVTGLGVAGLLSHVLPMSPLVRTATSIVGVALSVDYVLFLLRGPHRGVEGPRTVLLAGTVVAIGYGGLALAPTGELRSAAAVGIAVSLLAALAAISLTARRRRALETMGDRGPPPASRWLAWGRFVTRHPWLVLVAAALPLGSLALAASRARLVTPLERWLPDGIESTDAMVDLDRAGRLSALGALRILLVLPAGQDALAPEGWTALRTVGVRLGTLPGAAGVRSLATIGTGELVVAREVLPAVVRASYLSRDRRTAIIDLLPDPRVPSESITGLVRQIRALDVEAAAGMSGARVRVAGLPALALDYEAAIRRALPAIVIAVSLATLIAIVIGLRAPVVALKAVVLNLLVATAAVGATVLVFQDGFGATWIGHAAQGSVLPTVPVVAFGITFGLGMDYELFLIAAVRAARTGNTTSEPEAIAIGVATSGRVITRAAAVMATLFLAVATSDLLPLAMVGVALTAAVVLDATVVRLALAPALLRIAGRWNWWPERPR